MSKPVMATKEPVTWLIVDNEADEMRRFRCNTINSDAALKAYIRWLNPRLPWEDVCRTAGDFNGEIWYEGSVHDIGMLE